MFESTRSQRRLGFDYNFLAIAQRRLLPDSYVKGVRNRA